MKRLASLDALRGFDMFFLMGGFGLVCLIAGMLGFPDAKQHLCHVKWHGLQFEDTIFPLFLFLAGASFPFSAAKSLSRGMTKGALALKCLKRGLVLSLLGIVYGGFLGEFNFSDFRIMSVLGRIGLAWMLGAWIYLACGVRQRAAIAVGLLALTTVVTLGVLAPNAPAGADPFSPEGNIGCWLDRVILGRHAYKHTVGFDPEGFAGLLPAVVTALLGMFAGDLVRRGDGLATGRKALELLALGVGCCLLGWGLSFVFPINKSLWSPSFTLVVGGYSFAMFALFYWIVDVRGWSKWSFFFRVIGMNSITIYLAQRFIDFGKIDHGLFKGFASLFPTDWHNLILQAGYVLVCWLFLYFLYRKDVFLRV